MYFMKINIKHSKSKKKKKTKIMKLEVIYINYN